MLVFLMRSSDGCHSTLLIYSFLSPRFKINSSYTNLMDPAKPFFDPTRGSSTVRTFPTALSPIGTGEPFTVKIKPA
jgi:hypothetical protein